MRFGTVTNMMFTKPMHSHPLGAAAALATAPGLVVLTHPKSTERASAYVGLGNGRQKPQKETW